MRLMTLKKENQHQVLSECPTDCVFGFETQFYQIKLCRKSVISQDMCRELHVNTESAVNVLSGVAPIMMSHNFSCNGHLWISQVERQVCPGVGIMEALRKKRLSS